MANAPAIGLTLELVNRDTAAFAPLTAGAMPSADDIRTWLASLRPADRLADFHGWLAGVPESVRTTAGLLLALVGLIVLVASWRRARRPTQGDLVRRVAAAGAADRPRPDKQPAAALPRPASPNQPPPAVIAVHASPRAGQSLSAGTALAADAAGPGGLDPTAAARLARYGNLAGPYPPPAATPQAPPAMRAFLMAEQFTRDDQPIAVPLGRDVVRIGRHQENDIRFEDRTVHRYHALVHRAPTGDFHIRDLSGSGGNGVYVNGHRVDEAGLRSGDLIELGAIRLRFQQQRPS